jgi:hypothetical protein
MDKKVGRSRPLYKVRPVLCPSGHPVRPPLRIFKLIPDQFVWLLISWLLKKE